MAGTDQHQLPALRAVDRAVGAVGRSRSGVRKAVGSVGFPWVAPPVPSGVELPEPKATLGPHYDTDWARSPAARAARAALTGGPLRLAVKAIADPEVRGVDRLADLRALDEPPPLIFAPNHQSHLDTPLFIQAAPPPWRERLVVAAAADYFFGTHLTSAASALALNAIPIDRTSVGRQSADLARELVDDGWSLLIYPEGGRSPDGWGQPFRGGAAYLSARTGAPVVPVYIDGTGAILGKGMSRPKRGRTTVTFGAPLWPEEGESTRRFNERIEQAVTLLADEARTDFWSARRRAADGASPALTGPEYGSWRRAWALGDQRRSSEVGQRRRQRRLWPKLDDR